MDNLNLAQHVIGTVRNIERIKRDLEKLKAHRDRCIQCFEVIGPGKEGRRCKKCRGIE